MIDAADRPRVKAAGAIVLALLVGFAVGNGHATRAALDGSGKWWQAKVTSTAAAARADERGDGLEACYDLIGRTPTLAQEPRR